MQAENMVSLIKVDFVKEYVDSSTCTNCCYLSCLSRCLEFNNKIHEMDVKKKGGGMKLQQLLLFSSIPFKINESVNSIY